ncbi:MAG: hypothetical protein ABI276_05065 [Acidimicrobiales bacterium]
MAQPQLALLESPPDWRLDEQTKAVGRRGVAQARAALEAAIGRHVAADATSTTDGVPAVAHRRAVERHAA